MLPPQHDEGEPQGLKTAEALERLHKEVVDVLAEYEAADGKKRRWLWEWLDHRNQHSGFSWVSAVSLLGSAVVLLSGTAAGHVIDGDCCLLAQGLLLMGLLAFNFTVALLETRLRHREIYEKAMGLTSILKRCSEICFWRENNYPHLCSPYSPCITLQWTYRDGRLVNLPWALLVAGDTVLIRPGQPAPGLCSPLRERTGPDLRRGEVYSPPPNGGHDDFSQPTARQPLHPQPYTMRETPYSRNLRQCLEEGTTRPVTLHNRQRYLLVTACVEELAIPYIWAFVLLVNGLRLAYVSDWVTAGSAYEMLLLGPVRTLLPLLPLVFPTAWHCLNCLGNARLAALQHNSLSKKDQADPFEENDFSVKLTSDLELSSVLIRRLFVDILLGRHHSFPRSANLLHVLGCVTALCCVDKKGILSWPNPTAERVFFLRSAKDPTFAASDSGVGGGGLGGSIESQNNLQQPTPSHSKHQPQRSDVSDTTEMQTTQEQLDLTHDKACPFRLQFDDPSWSRYLKSLKPLGLAILLNTCNMDTQDHYTQFCSHVTCEALYNEDLVPVTNRRCLCELAKQIGFTENATSIYSLDQQLSTFRHVQPEIVRQDIEFARVLALATKLKFPFPHMVAVVVKDKSNFNKLQLFSQGTADILLDSCIEYYDGKDVKTLSDNDRRKIQDFYQRTSLTAYCTAFAYRPLVEVASIDDKLSQVYMELPADSKELYEAYHCPTPQAGAARLEHCQSADSILTSSPYEEHITDVEDCFRVQCNQIFIGMVTMQYQAQTEMVQLIEQLERACIRFVHFSKENELRSRVFSEKMGLESGWNCHISLHSERCSGSEDSKPTPPAADHIEVDMDVDYGLGRDDLRPLLSSRRSGTLSGSRTMSFSAPSAINLEPRMSYSHPLEQVVEEDPAPQPSQLEWQSLSCLTDSTEQSAPVNFDMSNRAKLPIGIDKIRPHLELVDNVPLLVSLFTDCTVSTTREMIHIMQDYGEIVCVMGSSANGDNVGIFLQANASFAVQPLFPQVCQKVSVYTETTPEQGPSPVELSNELNSLPCSMQDPGSIFLLIMEARHFMHSTWNCVQYWICGLMTLSTIQLLATIFPLPPIWSVGQVLWLSTVIVPLLSLSLVPAKTDPQVMQRAGNKHLTTMTLEMALFVLWCYGSKFLLTAVLVPFMFAMTLSHHYSEATGETWRILSSPHPGEPWGGWGRHPQALVWSQNAAALLVVVQFVTISASFVHREYLSWRRGPLRNYVWLIAACLALVLQTGYSVAALWWADVEWSKLPWEDLSVLGASPPLVFIINEIVKWQEINANERYRKRARLDFGTKLGMNSPF